ncbi:MAG: DNA-formamidopyrimidine glycosylase [Planctomycetales bacterium]|nr:DNA-formamidopyrimidine glycosylase [Planctomycetales bacterium]
MPELPEVETMRRGIAVIAGKRIANVRRVACRRRPIYVAPSIPTFRRRVLGQTVATVDRLGKRIVLRLASHDAIVIEPRMTGLVLLAAPPSTEHLRWALDFEGPAAKSLLYWDRRGLGSVRLFRPAELQSTFGPPALGPDALAITVEQLRENLGKSRREVKPALLDQKAVAGIGNLYASEILFLAGVHPQTRCDRLTLRQWISIHHSLGAVLREAIRYEGSTLSDGTYRNALNKAGGYQNQHRVYDKESAPCPQCGNAIERIVQTQRSTFFCRRCQTRRNRTS